MVLAGGNYTGFAAHEVGARRDFTKGEETKETLEEKGGETGRCWLK